MGSVAILMALCGLLVWVPGALAAPANDNFAEAEDLGATLPMAISRSNAGATKEVGEGEVANFSAGHSVWFEWEAPSTGFVTIGSCEATFHAVIGVFTGAEVGSLTKVAEGNADEGPHCSYEGREFTFKAVSGTSYKIAVDGYGFHVEGPPPPTEGEFTLRIESTPVPANDDFQNAVGLVGSILGQPGEEQIYRASASGYTWGAGKQAGEPDHGGDLGGASVWYSWTAPTSGTARITACCDWAPLIGVYFGSAVDALTTVPAGPGAPVNGTFDVEAGTSYRIAVDGRYDTGLGEAETGSFSLSVYMQIPSSPASPGLESPKPPIDIKPPDTTIFKRSSKGRPAILVFTFHSSEPGSTFRCKLDKRAFHRCHSPWKVDSAARGRHVLRVVAVDETGSVDPTPALVHFGVAGKPHARH
jgi:hypothetical protein